MPGLWLGKRGVREEPLWSEAHAEQLLAWRIPRRCLRRCVMCDMSTNVVRGVHNCPCSGQGVCVHPRSLSTPKNTMGNFILFRCWMRVAIVQGDTVVLQLHRAALLSERGSLWPTRSSNYSWWEGRRKQQCAQGLTLCPRGFPSARERVMWSIYLFIPLFHSFIPHLSLSLSLTILLCCTATLFVFVCLSVHLQ